MNYEERKSIGDAAYKKANKMGNKDCTLTINDFSNEELKSFLVTCDGQGPNFKEMALNKLIERIIEDTKQDVWNSYEDMGKDC
jgi:hypothetical protein